MKTILKFFPAITLFLFASSCKDDTLLDDSPCTVNVKSDMYLLGSSIVDSSTGLYTSYLDGSTRVFKYAKVASDVCTEAPVSIEFRVALLDENVTGISATGKASWQIFFEKKCSMDKAASDLKCNLSGVSLKDGFGSDLSGWFSHIIELSFETKGSYFADTQFLKTNVISIESIAKYREYTDSSTCPCLNGGTCNNGTCSCPTGYTGDSCQTQVIVGTAGNPRFNLQFTNHTEVDLDLYVTTPNNNTISYNNKVADGGQLDVDCYCTSCPNGPSENIFWVPGTAPSGTYTFWVNYYGDCGSPGTASTYTLRRMNNESIEQTYTGTLTSGSSQSYTFTIP